MTEGACRALGHAPLPPIQSYEVVKKWVCPMVRDSCSPALTPHTGMGAWLGLLTFTLSKGIPQHCQSQFSVMTSVARLHASQFVAQEISLFAFTLHAYSPKVGYRDTPAGLANLFAIELWSDICDLGLNRFL